MKKIFIYEIEEVVSKRQQLKDKVVNYVKLKRPTGLEEHWPEVGDIVNLYLPGKTVYIKHKIADKKKDGIYIIDLDPVYEYRKYNIKINLKDKGLESLLNLPEYINNEIKGLSKLTKMDADLNNSLGLYFDVSEDFIDNEHFYEFIKKQTIEAIKNKIKDIDVWVDPYHYGTVEVYKNEPLIEEVIDENYNTDEGIFEFKGIIEKEIYLYRIFIRTNIYKK